MYILKKIGLVFLIFVLIFNCSFSYADDLSITGEAAILIDAETGQILYEKNADMQLFPASTTKIITAILAIEYGNLNDIVTIDEEVVKRTDGTHIALEVGEQMSLDDLLHALLIESANDAAVAIAIHISGSVEDFAELMNEKAKEIGATNTHFTNPNGLPDENHLTTAHDLAMMAKYAMKNETFREIVKNYTYIIPPTNKKEESRYLKSNNRLLYSNKKINVDGKVVPIKYEWANGVKSGYTTAAQQCLVSSAAKGNMNLICVVLKSTGTDIYVDTHKLLNYGFDNFEKAHLSFKNEFIKNVNIENGSSSYVSSVADEDLYVTIPKGSRNNIEKTISLDENLQAPIVEGQALGKIEYFLNGNSLGTVNIVSTMNIPKKTVEEKIKESFFFKEWWLILLILFIFWRILSTAKKAKRRKRRKNAYIKVNDPIK